MDAYYGSEGQLYVLRVFWLFRCRIVAYNMWWDGHYCVDAGMLDEWKLSWCPIFVVDYYDIYCVCLFFGCHLSPVDRFQSCLRLIGYLRPTSDHLEDLTCYIQPKRMLQLCGE